MVAMEHQSTTLGSSACSPIRGPKPLLYAVQLGLGQCFVYAGLLAGV